jgi:hypothetical protein
MRFVIERGFDVIAEAVTSGQVRKYLKSHAGLSNTEGKAVIREATRNGECLLEDGHLIIATKEKQP